MNQDINIYKYHFIDGTLRIKESGYYKLMEDILFFPERCIDISNRKDKPKMGWFCAISIETNDIILDLNGYKIELDEEFIKKNIDLYGNSFISCINLNNAITNIDIINYDFGYLDDIEYDFKLDPCKYNLKTANNIIIFNGQLGKSTNSIINGFNNKDIEIKYIDIYNFEECGIHLNDVENIKIKNCLINGEIDKQLTKPIYSNFVITKKLLENNIYKKNSLTSKIDPEQYIKFLEEIIKLHKESNLAEEGYSPCNVKGIYIGQNIDIFERGNPIIPIDYSKECTNKNISICNVQITNIKTDTKFCEGIRNRNDNSLLISGIYGIIKWNDILLYKGFLPNKQSQAFAYNMLNLFGKQLSEEYKKTLKSIIYKNQNLFYKQSFKERTILINGYYPHGTYGIRIDNCKEIFLKDLVIENFESIGKKPINSSLIKKREIKMPLKGNSKDQYDFHKLNSDYSGNDLIGIGINLKEKKDICIENLRIRKFTSRHGKVYAIQNTYSDMVIENKNILYNYTNGTVIDYIKE